MLFFVFSSIVYVLMLCLVFIKFKYNKDFYNYSCEILFVFFKYSFIVYYNYDFFATSF